MKKYIELEEQKMILFQILQNIDSFCRENGITYYLFFGTLLGAVRHKGFIPWDDDVDIVMLRKDYDRFINSYKDKTGRYELICPENNKRYYLPMGKVIDTRTVVSENVPGAEPIGIYVDIFPLDNCPGTFEESSKFARRIKPYRSVVTVKNLALSKDRALIKNIVLCALKALLFFFPRRAAIRKIIKKASSYKDTKTEYVGELSLMPYGDRELFKAEWLEQVTEIEFEKGSFFAPAGYHEILTTCYGEYMVLPPEEKRTTHHVMNAWWK